VSIGRELLSRVGDVDDVIEFATDLKEVYPEKKITILHSRQQFMPLYPVEVHIAGQWPLIYRSSKLITARTVMDSLNKLGVEYVLGERVMTWPDDPEHLDGQVKILRTDKGRQFEADIVVSCHCQQFESSRLTNKSYLVQASNHTSLCWLPCRRPRYRLQHPVSEFSLRSKSPKGQ